MHEGRPPFDKQIYSLCFLPLGMEGEGSGLPGYDMHISHRNETVEVEVLICVVSLPLRGPPPTTSPPPHPPGLISLPRVVSRVRCVPGILGIGMVCSRCVVVSASSCIKFDVGVSVGLSICCLCVDMVLALQFMRPMHTLPTRTMPHERLGSAGVRGSRLPRRAW